MPRLNRCHGHGFLHFVTFSCYHRLPFLRPEPRRDLFLRILEQVRRSYRFVVVGYVVMPEHVHLLLSEPGRANPASVIQVLKQRFARAVLRELRARSVPGQGCLWSDSSTQAHVWQARFYDFVVYTKKKRMEKLHYMHQNPVRRGLVLEEKQWDWSSFRHYACDERGPVLVNEPLRAEMNPCDHSRRFAGGVAHRIPPRLDKVKSPSGRQPKSPVFENREGRGSLSCCRQEKLGRVGSRNPRPSKTAKAGAASVAVGRKGWARPPGPARPRVSKSKAQAKANCRQGASRKNLCIVAFPPWLLQLGIPGHVVWHLGITKDF